MWPWAERRLRGDPASHNLLERPRDAPGRTAFGAAFLTWVGSIFFAGSSDRLFFQFQIDYEAQVHVYRVLVVVLPIVAFFATKAVCDEVRRAGAAPLRGGPPTVVRRRDDGSFEALRE
jgi:ubiquinol-cytochrome c reductase cytochrome b subunit